MAAKRDETSIQSVQIGQRQYGLDVFSDALREYDGKSQFDVITFINVLDHSNELWKEIDRARSLLKSGGLIYMRFPNGFLHIRIYRLALKFGLANRVHKFLIFHQYPFTQRYIRSLLSNSGFSGIIILNSLTSEGDSNKLFYRPTLAQFIKRSIYLMAKSIEVIRGRKILFGASLKVIAVER